MHRGAPPAQTVSAPGLADGGLGPGYPADPMAAASGRRFSSLLGAVMLAAVSGCGTAPSGPPTDVPGVKLQSELALVAEGPCSRLSVQAVGDRRLLVYGDTGYDLRGWLPGDELAAAQSFVEIRGDVALRNQSLLRGLPRNAGGYVPGDLTLGGSFDRRAWLLVGTTRYAEFAAGALFERTVVGYAYHAAQGWRRVDTEPVELPPESSGLPELERQTMCGQPSLRFVPLASATTAAGGVLVAGRCDDERPVNYPDTTVLVAHGRPRAATWHIERAPDTDVLDGIINLDLYAASDDEAYLVVFEPFKSVEERKGYLARYDGRRWRSLDAPHGGLMSVAGTGDGTLWLASGRHVYRRPPAGTIEPVPLPLVRHARSRAKRPGVTHHVHAVEAFPNGEVWVEASYRVGVREEGADDLVPVWASALYSNRPLRLPLYCDAREPADGALVEVQ